MVGGAIVYLAVNSALFAGYAFDVPVLVDLGELGLIVSAFVSIHAAVRMSDYWQQEQGRSGGSAWVLALGFYLLVGIVFPLAVVLVPNAYRLAIKHDL